MVCALDGTAVWCSISNAAGALGLLLRFLGLLGLPSAFFIQFIMVVVLLLCCEIEEYHGLCVVSASQLGRIQIPMRRLGTTAQDGCLPTVRTC